MPDVYQNSLTVWCRQGKEDEPVKKLSEDAEKSWRKDLEKTPLLHWQQ